MKTMSGRHSFSIARMDSQDTRPEVYDMDMDGGEGDLMATASAVDGFKVFDSSRSQRREPGEGGQTATSLPILISSTVTGPILSR
jgi:hypothetical protein